MKIVSLFTFLLAFGMTPYSLAQYPNVRVSNASARQPEEVTIAVNPMNPLNLVAGSNLKYVYTTTDGGMSWKQDSLVSPYGVWGDPCVIFDHLGSAYYSHLSNEPQTPLQPVGFLARIVVQKSTDAGSTWSPGEGIGYDTIHQHDKEWLAADLTNSPYQGNLYVAWTEFDTYGSDSTADSSRILFSRSTDHGLTWTKSVRVSDVSGNCVDSDSTVEGAVPAVGPNGEVYLSWAGPLGIMFDKSTDGGLTFGSDRFVASEPGGWDFGVPGIYRCNGLPVTACDVSNSPYRGTVYVLWSDQRNGADDTDVFLAKSTNGGDSWRSVTRVNNDDSHRQQFFPWLAIDQTTGYLYAVYYDRRATTGNTTDVYMAESTDGGDSFQNFKISDESFVPVDSVFFGDYINVCADQRKVHPIWMRMDGKTLSVWTTTIEDTTAVAVNEEHIQPLGFELKQNYPNPFNPSTTIQYTVEDTRGQGLGVSNVQLLIYNALGMEVATLVNARQAPGNYEVKFDASRLASGVYFYRFTVGDFTAARAMLLLK